MRLGREFAVVPLANNTTSLVAALHSGVWRQLLHGVGEIIGVCAHFFFKCDSDNDGRRIQFPPLKM